MGSGRRGLAMYSSYSYGSSSYGGSSYVSPSYGPTQTSRYRDMVSNMYGGLPTPNSGYSSKYTSQYSPSSSSCSVYSSRGTTLPPTRGASIPPPLLDRSARTRTVFSSEGDESFTSNRHLRLKSPSIPRERTRDELIDSIVHTRTREHRAMPGFKSATDFDERRSLQVDC